WSSDVCSSDLRVHDGEAEFGVEHQHAVAFELAEVVAAERLGAAQPEPLRAGQAAAGAAAGAEHGPQRQRLPVPLADLDVRADVGLKLGELGGASQPAAGPLHR